MPNRSCFVDEPEEKILYIADVHRRALKAFDVLPWPTKDDEKIAHSRQRDAIARRLELASESNHFIVVKKELNTTEHRAMHARNLSAVGSEGEPRLNLEQAGMAMVVEYLLDWSFTDRNGDKVKYDPGADVKEREAVVGNLRPALFRDVLSAIDWWNDQADAEIEERKNDQDGETKSSPISPSAELPALAISK